MKLLETFIYKKVEVRIFECPIAKGSRKYVFTNYVYEFTNGADIISSHGRWLIARDHAISSAKTAINLLIKNKKLINPTKGDNMGFGGKAGDALKKQNKGSEESKPKSNKRAVNAADKANAKNGGSKPPAKRTVPASAGKASPSKPKTTPKPSGNGQDNPKPANTQTPTNSGDKPISKEMKKAVSAVDRQKTALNKLTEKVVASRQTINDLTAQKDEAIKKGVLLLQGYGSGALEMVFESGSVEVVKGIQNTSKTLTTINGAITRASKTLSIAIEKEDEGKAKLSDLEDIVSELKKSEN